MCSVVFVRGGFAEFATLGSRPVGSLYAFRQCLEVAVVELRGGNCPVLANIYDEVPYLEKA